jgi:hypothetical protein
MSKGENTVKWIKGQKISWLGHLERMEEDRMAKKIFNREMEGTRRRGRPRNEWKEEAERDLQVLGVRRWRELVIGKNGRILFDRPKPAAGCSANGRRRRNITPLSSEVWTIGLPKVACPYRRRQLGCHENDRRRLPHSTPQVEHVCAFCA